MNTEIIMITNISNKVIKLLWKEILRMKSDDKFEIYGAYYALNKYSFPFLHH